MRKEYQLNINYQNASLFWINPLPTVTLKFVNQTHNNFTQYSYNGIDWTSVTLNQEITFDKLTYLRKVVNGSNELAFTALSGKYEIGGDGKVLLKLPNSQELSDTFPSFAGDTCLVSTKNLFFKNSSVYKFNDAFTNCTSLKETFDITHFKNKSADYFLCRSAFEGCTSLINGPKIIIKNFAGSHKQFNFEKAFKNCVNLVTSAQIILIEKDIYLGGEIDKATFKEAYYNCTSLINAYDLPPIKYMIGSQSMFENCSALVNTPKIDVLEWHAPLKYMFKNCSSLRSPLHTWMPNMTGFHFNLWNTTSTFTSWFESMYENCTNLEKISPYTVSVATDSSDQRFELTTMAKDIYKNCSKIKISDTTDYQNSIVLFTLYTGGQYFISSDFSIGLSGTGGTYTSNAVVNTTYYTSNEIV